MENVAVEIGRVLHDARLQKGHANRSEFVETTHLKGFITGEGLRKLEYGERLPKVETFLRVAKALGLPKPKQEEIVEKIVQHSAVRAIRRAGNLEVDVIIQGQPTHISRLPPHRKVEGFARDLTNELVTLVERYGLGEQDLAHFRRVARSAILRQIDKPSHAP